ncbi:MAG: hypothetical protein JNM66_17870 [Bryobacterales bacterium]|nr:hypothetical protein [Bryobacterales bacterium]
MQIFVVLLAITLPILSAQGNNPPVFISGSPGVTIATPQTFSFTARDTNGAADISRIYFLVNTSANIPANVCHGFYDQGANAFYLFNDNLSAVFGPLYAGGGDDLQYPMHSLRCRFCEGFRVWKRRCPKRSTRFEWHLCE